MAHEPYDGFHLGRLLAEIFAFFSRPNPDEPLFVPSGVQPIPAPPADQSAPVPDGVTPAEPVIGRRVIDITQVPPHARISGIDVSNHQGLIDWNRVAGAGHKFAIVKASEGGTNSRGKGFIDPNFLNNVRGASDAGLYVGTYHFATWYNADASNPKKDAYNEAEHYFAQIQAASARGPGFFPPTLDLEGSNKEKKYYPKKMAHKAIVEWAIHFLDRLTELSGPDIWIYTGYWFDYRLRHPLELRNYPLWLARYNRGENPTKAPADWPWLFWQYTGSGSCPGIRGKCDINKFRGSLDDLRLLAGIEPDTDPKVS